MAQIEPRTEAISKETSSRIEYDFYDANSLPVHKSRVVLKNKDVIHVYPFSYSDSRGVTKKKISEIEFRGWSNYDDLPKLLKPGAKVSLGHKKIAPLMRFLYGKYPKLEKLVIIKNGGTSRFSAKTVTLTLDALESICGAITKEISSFETRRKTAVQNALADVSSNFSPRATRLGKGSLTHFISFYDDINLSQGDVDTVLGLIAHAPLGTVKVTSNFIETSDRVNIAYLEEVIEKYEELLRVKGDNEKDWQEFFDTHGWILASVFPYQVILHKREAYVGGKTIENSEGRIVDFLFQNGFRDNYALLEIKTHNKTILKASAYREPDAYAMHEDCSGALSQCLDQKNIFLTEMGQKYTTLDPRVVLIIGRKDSLNESQTKAFELMRNNQKNVDVVTFDELLEKIRGLRSILQS